MVAFRSASGMVQSPASRSTCSQRARSSSPVRLPVRSSRSSAWRPTLASSRARAGEGGEELLQLLRREHALAGRALDGAQRRGA